MAELAKEYGLSDESRVRDWLKSYNGHRKFNTNVFLKRLIIYHC